jgi:hypothetical protein
MVLISILRLLGLKLNVQAHVVTLINDTAMALRHPADVETHNARNGREVFLCVSDYFIRCLGVGGIGPKNYDVRKHSSFYGYFSSPAQPGNTLRFPRFLRSAGCAELLFALFPGGGARMRLLAHPQTE